MISIAVIINDNFYKKVIGSSISFTSIFGATEILNHHSDIFSIVKPGIVNIKINGGSEDIHYFIFDGLISFLNNNEATIVTTKLFDLDIADEKEKSILINKLRNENIANYENIIKKINDI